MDEEEITLPADTLKILNQFLQEKAQREREELDKVQTKAGKEATFEEDWQLSQFWYNEETKRTIGKVVHGLIHNSDKETCNIALLSCPSLYATVKELHDKVKIFEYDGRFSAYGDDFVLYDFNGIDMEDNYMQSHYQNYDIIIADPPFLSEECITKVCKIIKKISKSPETTKIIFCSGEIVAPWLLEHLQLKQCTSFRPQHDRNLGNEFACYTNFNLDDFLTQNL